MDNVPQNCASSIITATSKRTFYNDYPHVCVCKTTIMSLGCSLFSAFSNQSGSMHSLKDNVQI